MKVRDYYEKINRIAPYENAFEWDNTGLMIGSFDAEVSSAAVALDLTSEVIDFAKSRGANLIVTHHPVIFHPIANLNKDNGMNKIILHAAENNMNVISAHTNLDLATAPYGVNYNFAVSLGLTDIKLAEDEFHYYGNLDGECVGVSCGAYDGETEWLKIHECTCLFVGEIKHSDAVSFCETGLELEAVGHYNSEFPAMYALANYLDADLCKIITGDGRLS